MNIVIYTEAMKNCHLIFLLLFFSKSLLADDFYSCELSVELSEVSDEFTYQQSNEQVLLEISFKPQEVDDKECEHLLGKKHTESLSLAHKNTREILKQKLKAKESIKLDHTFFSSKQDDGEQFIVQTWSLSIPEALLRPETIDNRYD